MPLLPRLFARGDRLGRRRPTALRAGAAVLGLALGGLALWRGEPGTALASLGLGAVAFAALRPTAREGSAVAAAVLSGGESGRGILKALPDPAIVVDGRALVLDANAGALALAPSLRVGHPLSFALRAPRVLDAIPGVLASGKVARAEYGGRIATEPTFEVTLSALERAGRGSAAVLLTFRDLTNQRRIERMRVDFVANVSHELRTPLATILGFVETLQGPARDDPGARERFLEVMRGQANRMKRLIDDLLQLSRVELKTHQPPTGTIDLVETVAHMVEIMLPLARERSVELRFERPPEPMTVVADRDEVLRLIENLVANAIKYGGNGGQVEAGLERTEDGRAVELSVRDHGPGIAPEHLPRLTERFYRVDVAESRAQGGTGLGLAIVKHIVTHHRGRLLIESELGEGCRVQGPFAER